MKSGKNNDIKELHPIEGVSPDNGGSSGNAILHWLKMGISFKCVVVSYKNIGRA